MMRRSVIASLALAGGCFEQVDSGSSWESASTITGELAPVIGPRPGAVDAAGCVVRIASWNVHYGADVDDLVTKLRDSQEMSRADVLLVQEIEAYPDETGTRTQRLADALNMTWMYAPAREELEGTHGISILSRHPLENASVRQLPYFDQPLNPRNRIAFSAELVAGTHRLQLINLHLDVRLGPLDRIRQLSPAVNDINDRVLIGGDFNTNPWAWFDGLVPLTATEAIVGQQQAAVIDDYFAGKHFTSAIPLDQSTVRGMPGFGMRIDNLYARDLAIVAAGVEHVDGSDHWPVWVDIDLCQ